jgi:alkylation response protein AidB-like acyl-CoA dehydrogenase
MRSLRSTDRPADRRPTLPAHPLSFSSLVNTQDHHLELRSSVAKLVGKYGRAYFQEKVKSGQKVPELWGELGAAGFLGAHVSERWGGGGGGMAEYNIIVEETAAQGCPLFTMVLQSICSPIIEQFGHHEMQQRWLPGLASGTVRMSFAITEPDAGTNTHKITTTATPMAGGGWEINGAKYWTSAVDEAHAILVVARSPYPGPNGRHPLSLFIVDPNDPGISRNPIDVAVQSPDKQFMLFFDGVRVGPDALVGTEGNGLRQVFVGLNTERIAVAAMNNGVSCYAIDRAVDYANDRQVWGTPIGAHQGVSHPLAEATIKVQLARLMTVRAAELNDSGQDASEAANMAKFAAADASLRAVDQAIQVHGGNGFATEYGLADLWLIARVHKTAPVSREMVLNHISMHTLGLPRSY